MDSISRRSPAPRRAQATWLFRPTKLWDVLDIHSGHLVAVIELKSQVRPSSGNIPTTVSRRRSAPRTTFKRRTGKALSVSSPGHLPDESRWWRMPRNLAERLRIDLCIFRCSRRFRTHPTSSATTCFTSACSEAALQRSGRFGYTAQSNNHGRVLPYFGADQPKNVRCGVSGGHRGRGGADLIPAKAPQPKLLQ